jgi:PAS domain-containing protein
MDTTTAQSRDRLSTLEQENALLKSRLQSCEQSYALLQAEIAGHRQKQQDRQKIVKRSAELERHNIELQQTLDRLSESEERYRTLFELSNEGIFHFEFEQPISTLLPLSKRVELAYQTNRLTEVNQAFAQQYGLDSPSAIVGTRISDFYVADSQKNTQTNEKLFSNFQIRNCETDEVDQFGNRRYFLSSVVCTLQGDPCPLPPFIGMNLLRIGQEALINALKHAQAQTVTIELVYECDRILLTIRDNGRGFTPPTAIDTLNGGFGLMGMYERCDRIGAQLSLTSQPGQGTQILVEAPLG